MKIETLFPRINEFLKKMKLASENSLMKKELAECLEYVNSSNISNCQKLNALFEILASLRAIQKSRYPTNLENAILCDIFSCDYTVDTLSLISSHFSGDEDVFLVLSGRCQMMINSSKTTLKEVDIMKKIIRKRRAVERYLELQKEISKKLDEFPGQDDLIN